jgi:hypothetical protein
MWPSESDQRLLDWHDLRTCLHSTDIETALIKINDWWWRCPIVGRYLHWHDWQSWPDPWQLLIENTYCDLARALGIVYTVKMTKSLAGTCCELIDDGEYNLVSISQGKYILNWSPGNIVNIRSPSRNMIHKIDSEQLIQKIG